MLHNPGVGSSQKETCPERLTVVIATKRCSYKVLTQGCEYLMYVNLIFLNLIFNKFANISKNTFSICHYGLLCGCITTKC